MDESSVFWLRVAAALYSLGLLHTIRTLLNQPIPLHWSVVATFRVAVVLHGVALVEGSIFAGRLPAGNVYQTLSLCAFLLALLFLLVHWRYQFGSVSVFLFPLIFVMTSVAAMQSPVETWSSGAARDVWLILHIVLALLGYASLILTALASIFYLVHERQLKTKTPVKVLERLPPLATLDNLISRSMNIGFVLITLGIVAGTSWAFVESGTRWISDPRFAVFYISWAFCLVMVFLRVTAGWRGRKAAILAVTGVGFVAVSWVAHVGLRSVFVQ